MRERDHPITAAQKASFRRGVPSEHSLGRPPAATRDLLPGQPVQVSSRILNVAVCAGEAANTRYPFQKSEHPLER